MSKRKIINAVFGIESAALLWYPMSVLLAFYIISILDIFSGGKLERANASVLNFVFTECIGNGDIIIGVSVATVFMLTLMILGIVYGLHLRKKNMKILKEELDKIEFDSY